eukprot:3159231-Pleurochrysis_carterae.AAC.1
MPNTIILFVAVDWPDKYSLHPIQTRCIPKLAQDENILSFTIALNDRSEYEGGGTCFEELRPVSEGPATPFAPTVRARIGARALQMLSSLVLSNLHGQMRQAFAW